jgi:hypothetical protein
MGLMPDLAILMQALISAWATSSLLHALNNKAGADIRLTYKKREVLIVYLLFFELF